MAGVMSVYYLRCCFCGYMLPAVSAGETVRCPSCESVFTFRAPWNVRLTPSSEADSAAYVRQVLGVSPSELDDMTKEQKLQLVQSRAGEIAAEIRKLIGMVESLDQLPISSFLHPEIDRALVDWYTNDALSHLHNHARWAERDSHQRPNTVPEVIDEEWAEYTEWATGRNEGDA